MIRHTIVLGVIAGLLLVVNGRGQAVDSATQARGLLAQLLAASGYSSNSIAGFTATGTITHFGGLGSQTGTVTIKARGHDQFRMDSAMPNGTRTVSFDRNGGKRKEANGRSVDLPAQNTLAAINPVLPYLEIANALGKPDYALSYQGLTQDGGRQLHQVRVRRIISKAQDPSGLVEDLTQVDYFIDAQTLQIARIASTATATTNINERFPQVIELESYAGKSGIAVPTRVRLRVAGSPMWEMQLTDLRGSGNLTDADFTVQ